ncbi:MAG: hypothetical protein HYY18_09065 [Planctomycetes bacterium]|nr:hypothetical protein [Planctomycetota bacterium]
MKTILALLLAVLVTAPGGRKGPRHEPERRLPGMAPSRLDFGKQTILMYPAVRGTGSGEVQLIHAGQVLRIRSAGELAAQLRSLRSTWEVRGFFNFVDDVDLPGECGRQGDARRAWWERYDQGMSPRHSARPGDPYGKTGRIVPLWGGFLVERFVLRDDGKWRHLREFLAPGRLLVEEWEN